MSTCQQTCGCIFVKIKNATNSINPIKDLKINTYDCCNNSKSYLVQSYLSNNEITPCFKSSTKNFQLLFTIGSDEYSAIISGDGSTFHAVSVNTAGLPFVFVQGLYNNCCWHLTILPTEAES